MWKPAQNDAATATDRRVLVRHPCEVAGRCVPPLAANRARWSATIANVSAGGAMLIINRRFEKGTLLNIEIPLADEIVHLPAYVIHVNRRADDSYGVGCLFTRPLSADSLQTLVDVADE